MSSNTYNNPANVMLEVGLWLIIIFGFFLCVLLLPVAVYTKVFLLVGVWAIDIYFKTMLEYENKTAFADLSFAAFILVTGQITESLMNPASTGSASKSDSFQRLVLTAAFLCFIWLLNLRTCRVFNKQPRKPRINRFAAQVGNNLIWVLSTILALISLIGAVSPYYLEELLK